MSKATELADALLDFNTPKFNPASEAAFELRRLALANAELERDAARYRFMRSVPICMAWPGYPRMHDLDEAIDAALKEATES